MTDRSAYMNMSFLSYWFKLVNTGIRSDLSFDQNKRIRVVNSISLWIIVASILTIVRWYSMGLNEFQWLTGSGIAAMSLIIFLNGRGFYRPAGILFFIYIPLHITVISSFFPFGSELFIFPMMVISGFVFRNRALLVLYLVMLGFMFILLSSDLFPVFDTQITPEYQTIYYLVSAMFSLILCYLSINLFIRQYEENRSEIMIMNEMLNESVQTAKKEASFKALLVREMNHRVKNNLQLISSLLTLQEKNLKDSSARKALQEARARAHSIALIHDRLSTSKAIDNVNISIYLKDLMKGIFNIIPDFSDEIEFKYSCDEIVLQVDDAVSIGLLINELITNSIQHGLSGDDDDKMILLNVRKLDQDEMMIIVEDSGTGLKENYTPKNKGLGLELVESLTKKYNGEIVVDDERNRLTAILNVVQPKN